MTSTIIFKTDSGLKKQAQKTADDMGLTLTAIMNNFLTDFVENKSVSFGNKLKKFRDPYGIFKGAEIAEKDINEVTSSWDKILNDFT
jgi:addiction module RelB/DinJ family antitoxin